MRDIIKQLRDNILQDAPGRTGAADLRHICADIFADAEISNAEAWYLADVSAAAIGAFSGDGDGHFYAALVALEGRERTPDHMKIGEILEQAMQDRGVHGPEINALFHLGGLLQWPGV